MVAVGGDAFGQLVNTDPRAQAQHHAGVIVPMGGQDEFVPVGMGDDGLDDVEEWETSPGAPVLVDAVGEFNRACQGGGDAHSRHGGDSTFGGSYPVKETRDTVDG